MRFNQQKNDLYENLLSISFVGQTKILQLTGEEVEEIEIEGWFS